MVDPRSTTNRTYVYGNGGVRTTSMPLTHSGRGESTVFELLCEGKKASSASANLCRVKGWHEHIIRQTAEIDLRSRAASVRMAPPRRVLQTAPLPQTVIVG